MKKRAVPRRKRKHREAEVRQYQRQLRFLASELAKAEERERHRVAADLHDVVGRALTLAKMKLDLICRDDKDGRLAGLLAEPANLIDQAVRDMWSTIFELSPPPLYELGLEAALKWLVEKYREEHPSIRFAFEDDGQPKPLADDVRAMLYRAVRELLFNVVRHAKAGQVTVACLRDGDKVSVEVADDGRGFDPAAATTRETRKGGFGLFSIRERLACLGGRFEVKSRHGCGTKALLVGPLQGVRKRKERR